MSRQTHIYREVAPHNHLSVKAHRWTNFQRKTLCSQWFCTIRNINSNWCEEDTEIVNRTLQKQPYQWHQPLGSSPEIQPLDKRENRFGDDSCRYLIHAELWVCHMQQQALLSFSPQSFRHTMWSGKNETRMRDKRLFNWDKIYKLKSNSHLVEEHPHIFSQEAF